MILIDNDTSTERVKRWLRAEAARLGTGERLPSTRMLVQAQQVSPLTVSRAIAELVREGVVVTQPGAGTFVAKARGNLAADSAGHSWQSVVLAERVIDTNGLSPLADPPHAEGVISLGAGYLHSSLMPLTALRAALARTARVPDSWERPPVAGLHGLRSWFAQAVSPGVDAEDVLITSGGQSALSAVFRALLPSGSPLLIESPTYPGALAAARAAGLRPVPVPTDQHGIIPEYLAEAFGRTSAQAVFCQPACHNPTGGMLGSDRRAALLGAAAAAGAFVIDDGCARWLHHGNQLPAPLLDDDADGRVIHLTSLTKAASPSLRIGAIVARGPVTHRLRALRAVDDLFVARPLQETALDLVTRPAWERHLKELRRTLARRATILLQAADRHLPATDALVPTGGMHVWVTLPRTMDDVQTAAAAHRHGVIVMAGRPFFPAEAPGSHLRLAFSGAATEADLVEGIRRLAAAASELGSGE